MTVDVDGGASGRVERTHQVESVHCTEPKYHLVSRYDYERLQNIRHGNNRITIKIESPLCCAKSNRSKKNQPTSPVTFYVIGYVIL